MRPHVRKIDYVFISIHYTIFLNIMDFFLYCVKIILLVLTSGGMSKTVSSSHLVDIVTEIQFRVKCVFPIPFSSKIL